MAWTSADNGLHYASTPSPNDVSTGSDSVGQESGFEPGGGDTDVAVATTHECVRQLQRLRRVAEPGEHRRLDLRRQRRHAGRSTRLRPFRSTTAPGSPRRARRRSASPTSPHRAFCCRRSDCTCSAATTRGTPSLRSRMHTTHPRSGCSLPGRQPHRQPEFDPVEPVVHVHGVRVREHRGRAEPERVPAQRRHRGLHRTAA